MRLFCRVCWCCQWRPRAQGLNMHTASGPLWVEPHTFSPWKAIFSKGPRFGPLSCHLCCLGIRIKEAQGRGYRKQAHWSIAELVGHMFPDRRGCKASFICQICVQMVKLVCGVFWQMIIKAGGWEGWLPALSGSLKRAPTQPCMLSSSRRSLYLPLPLFLPL